MLNKKTNTNKKLILVMVLIAISIMPMFAAGDTIDSLDTWASKILSLFSSNWVKVILLVALIVEALAMIIAGQNGGGGQIIKRFGPWIIGTIILLSASGICSYFVGSLEFTVS